MSRLSGIWGLPYVDLGPWLDLSALADVDDEITAALAEVEVSPTGGSLKHMGVVAPWMANDPYRDYGHVIARFSPAELARFVALADDPAAHADARAGETAFGDETDRPLSAKQARYLQYRHGVYFPWKVAYHLLKNRRWEDKHSAAGKAFDPEALAHFPRTVALLRALPFREIGRALIFGLEANDHAPAHRDSEPGSAETIAQSISISPRRDKRFYLASPDGARVVPVEATAYWFNDMDYHGVLADPFFRYSIRVDGVFEPAFVRRVRDGALGAPRTARRAPG